jgi:vacuolar-type H+-ATPase catalytic subunit A/Vma1
MLKDISIKAKKNCEITKKMDIIKTFCNFNKQHLGLFRNLTEKFRTEVGSIMKELDEKIVMANFVLEEAESNERERAKNDRGSLEKLK